jgi:hypothetical protein
MFYGYDKRFCHPTALRFRKSASVFMLGGRYGATRQNIIYRSARPNFKLFGGQTLKTGTGKKQLIITLKERLTTYASNRALVPFSFKNRVV